MTTADPTPATTACSLTPCPALETTALPRTPAKGERVGATVDHFANADIFYDASAATGSSQKVHRTR